MGRVLFKTEVLREAIKGNKDIERKIDEIVDRCSPFFGNYGIQCPKALNLHARHAHITNDAGIAWRYLTGAETNVGVYAEILALGRKDGSGSSKGKSGYNWSDTGTI